MKTNIEQLIREAWALLGHAYHRLKARQQELKDENPCPYCSKTRKESGRCGNLADRVQGTMTRIKGLGHLGKVEVLDPPLLETRASELSALERVKRAENILAAVKDRAKIMEWPAIQMLFEAYEKEYGAVKHG